MTRRPIGGTYRSRSRWRPTQSSRTCQRSYSQAMRSSLARGHLGRRRAPEAHAHRGADEPAGPDVADVLEAVEPDVAADHHVRSAALLEERERASEPRRKHVPEPGGQRCDLRLALGDQRLRTSELLVGVAGALRVDEDALALAEVERQPPQAGHLTGRVGRRAPHEVGGHPAPADVDGRKHLELVLDHEPQAEPVRVADHGIGQGVVDDARVADEDEHRAGGRHLEALDLEGQPEEHADALQVAARPVDAQVVDEAPAPQGAPAERPAGDHADERQAGDAPQLAEQEPPGHADQAHGHPRLPAHEPQGQVHERRGRQRRGKDQREHDERTGLDRHALRPSQEPRHRAAPRRGTAGLRSPASRAWREPKAQRRRAGVQPSLAPAAAP